jgi:pimeloyl-ACP methyl ester carboxylesterase
MVRAILRYAGWAVVLVAIACGAIVVVAQLSGRQKPLGVVSATARRHGVELRSGLIDTNGTRLHVVQAGPEDGPPVILLHGYPEFWWGWHEQIARLARAGFRVIAPDQRGYNASDKPAGIEAYQVDQLTGDVLGLMDALEIRQAYLAGHDWGGAIAWYLVIEHPERFRKLVMFNSAHPRAWVEARKEPTQEETINWFRTFFQIPWLPEVTARLGNWGLLAKNLRDTSRDGTFPESDLDYYRYAWDRDGAMQAMINWYRASFRYPKTLEGDGRVAVPTRIVWGMQDRFFASRMGRLSVEQCSNATLVELPDAGHWLLHEEPERTSREMIEFFGKP